MKKANLYVNRVKIISSIDYRNINFRGIDLKPVIQSIFNLENEQIEGILGNSSTFLVAYGIHKLLAPIRLSITLGIAPFLVKRLRKLGILKSPKQIKLNT